MTRAGAQRKQSILDSPSSFKIIKHPISFYNCHIIRILHATSATKAAEYFHLGFERRERPCRAVVNHVLTATCRLQITGSNLPECGTISLFLNTTQLPGQQPPAAPYSLIAYPVQGLPSAYPLSLTGATAPWTVNYPAGEPSCPGTATWALQLRTVANDATQEPDSCSTLLMQVETQEGYRPRSTPCNPIYPKHVFRRLVLPSLL